eukprot:14873966-Ditylum_brightwellii.AAC.1
MGQAVMNILEFLKSSYFLVIWNFDVSGRPRIVPEAELPPNTVTVTDANGYTAKLHQIIEKEGIEMLGVKKAATLDETTEFEMLMDKTSLYVSAKALCPFQPHKVWIGYQTVYRPCIQYPLCTSNGKHLAKYFQNKEPPTELTYESDLE